MSRSTAATSRRARALALGLALAAGAALAARAAERVDPLEVPSGPPPAPEQRAGMSAVDRIAAGATELRRRGRASLPTLAWAELMAGHADPDAARRAASLAPDDPAVRFEAFLRTRAPSELLAALGACTRSLPAQLWLASAALAALCAGVLGSALGLSVLGFGRTLTLHGHALGHLGRTASPQAWPGALLLLSAAALLPLAGIGPALVMAVLGAAAAVRLSARDARMLALALVLCGVALGPLLDALARIASVRSSDPTLLSSWRVDRGVALPEDEARLQARVATEAGDPVVALALASEAKRGGRIDDARRLLVALDATAGSGPLRARTENLRGILALSEGDLEASIRAFDVARSHEESAAVLYNLAQAHARGLQLVEREAHFEAARALDAELVARYAALESSNANQFLIELPLPAGLLWRRVLAPSREAAALSAALRRFALGPLAPDAAWIALPVLGVLSLLLRRRSIARCTRCLRPVCSRCGGRRSRGVCVRCERLLARDGRVDARIRKQEFESDRRRLAWRNRAVAAAGLLLPGAGALFEGRTLTGATQLALLFGAVGLLASARFLVTPVDLAALGTWLAGGLGAAAVALAYLSAVGDSLRRLRAGSSR